MKGHIKQRSKGSWTLWVDLGRDPETGVPQQNVSNLADRAGFEVEFEGRRGVRVVHGAALEKRLGLY